MRRDWIKSIFPVIAVFFYSSISAASVTYDESVNGDLGWGESFLLGPDNNYVSGSISVGSAMDIDGFYFTVPNNFKAKISLLGQIDLGGSPYGLSFSWELRRAVTSGDCSVACLSTYKAYAYQVFKSDDDVGYVLPEGGASLPSISTMPELAAGSYYLFSSGSVGSLVLVGDEPWSNYLYAMNYTAAFDVQPVPLPSTLYLFFTSLMALPVLAKKRKNAALSRALRLSA